MSRRACFVYGVAAYVLFLVAFLYAIGFVAELDLVPKGINDGSATSVASAITVDVLLLLLFAVQHNVMARPKFKAWWTRIVPPPIERSTYVGAASLMLLLLYWQWRPIPGIVWSIENGAIRGVLWGLYFLGWAIVLCSSFVIDHFELFGLKQVWQHLRGESHVTSLFSERSLYRWVRHPLMLGFIIAFWAAPTITWGRLLFAAVTTVWILIAIQIEERDLARLLGEPYREYCARTSLLVPMPPSSRAAD